MSWKWQLIGMEWLSRLFQEPSRLAGRYVTAIVGFGSAVVEDQFGNPRARRP